MRIGPTGIFRFAPAILLLPVFILLLAGCSDEDSPLKNDDPPVITDLEVWYVSDAASGAGDGSSWNDAFTSLQVAVDYAGDGDMVWVAAGSYFSPEPGDSSVPVLSMKAGVGMYGGFSTTDTELSDRDPDANRTILDGENRVRHVVIGADFARLDGFVIQSGYAFGSYPDNCGGGMLNHRVSPVVENCIFTSNDAAFHGAGMANIYASPLVRDCVFRINSAANNGAGVYNDDQNGIDGNPVFESCVFGPGNSCRFGAGMYNSWCEVAVNNCFFHDNLANHNGGGMYNTSSKVLVMSSFFRENRAFSGAGVYMNGIAGDDSTKLLNCLIETNTAYVSGGGVYLLKSSSILINCTIAENSAIYGGGISCWESEAEFTNSIIWGNVAHNDWPAIEIGTDTAPEITCCDIDQDGYGRESDGSADADGNIRLDPLFAAGSRGDWYISHTEAGQAQDSPCLDAGTLTGVDFWLVGYMTTRTDGMPDSGRIDLGFHYIP